VEWGTWQKQVYLRLGKSGRRVLSISKRPTIADSKYGIREKAEGKRTKRGIGNIGGGVFGVKTFYRNSGEKTKMKRKGIG